MRTRWASRQTRREGRLREGGCRERRGGGGGGGEDWSVQRCCTCRRVNRCRCDWSATLDLHGTGGNSVWHSSQLFSPTARGRFMPGVEASPAFHPWQMARRPARYLARQSIPTPSPSSQLLTQWALPGYAPRTSHLPALGNTSARTPFL